MAQMARKRNLFLRIKTTAMSKVIDLHAHVVFEEVFGVAGTFGPELLTDKDGLSFLRLSARDGYSPALELLGNLYAYNEKVKNNLVDAHTYFYLAAIIENKVDIGYHLIIEDEFSISEADINKSKKLAEACIKGGLKNCKLLAE